MTVSFPGKVTVLGLIFATLLIGPGSGTAASAQGGAPNEVASKMTGHWKLNRALSPGLTAPPPGRGRSAGDVSGARFAVAAPAFQRGGRGGGGGGGGAAGGGA
ncbi:MAG TPA: hypothetical protein VFT47_15020, partial [Vicinamibacterales bacterium]|nr:hypothetical protein [Vicinamibacterales bacterium]